MLPDCGLREGPEDASLRHGTSNPWALSRPIGITYTPECTSIEGLMVFIRWHVGFLKRAVGVCW